jgi:hypothetical protein
MPSRRFRAGNPACSYCSHPKSKHTNDVGCEKCACAEFRSAPEGGTKERESRSPTGYTHLMRERARKLKKGTWVREAGGGLPGSKR